MRSTVRPLIAVAGLAGLLLSGCHVETHKNGKNEDVSIGTPFGSMNVKTNDNVNTASIGLTQYPGSIPAHDEDNNKDKDSADVNMSFGSFHLAVKAASYQTADKQDKVLAFYRNDMKKYGDVLECQDKNAVGKPDRTSQGLTCSDDSSSHHGNINVGEGLELKAGSPQRQHIVSVEAKNGGTKIGLVALELPSQLNSHGDKDIE